MGCTGLKKLNLSNWYAPYASYIGYMFADCVNLEDLILDGWKMPMTADDEGILDNCDRLSEDFVYSKFMGVSGVSGDLTWSIDREGHLTISGDGDYELEYLPLDPRNDINLYMPEWCLYWNSILSAKVDVTNITTARNMFVVNVLTKIDLQNSDFSKVENADYMIEECADLIEIYSPKNINENVTITLPDGAWYDAFGNEVTKLTSNLDYSMKYTKELSDEVEIVYSGKDGDLDWTINNEGLLNITGSGEIIDADWRDYAEYITTAEVEVSGITDASGMFMDLYNVENIDLSKSDMSGVTSTHQMFAGCTNLEDIRFGEWNMSNVKDADFMFAVCFNLKNLDVSNWNMKKVYSMTTMFAYCTSLTEMDLSNWEVNSLAYASHMFEGCTNLEKINLSNWHAKNMQSIEYMFADCVNLEELILDGWYIALDAEDEGILDNCESLSEDFVYSKFYGASGVSGDLSWSIDKDGCLTISGSGDFELDYLQYKFDIYFLMPEWCYYGRAITKAKVNVTDITKTAEMFTFCEYMESIDFENFDTSKVTDMSGMFHNCLSLKYIDACDWDTSLVEDISGMFYYCENLRQADLGRWDVSNVETMRGIFNGCSNLTSVDLKKWNATKVTWVSYMFSGCEKLKAINLQNFDFSNVSDASNVFADCDSLRIIHSPKNINDDIEITLPAGLWDDENGDSVSILTSNIGESVKYTKRNAPIYNELAIEINGFQVRNDATGIRTVYSVNDPENQVVSVGLVYGLCDYANSEDMVVDSANPLVYSYEATEIGRLNSTVSEYTGATSYVMTMMFGDVNNGFYQAPTKVRAYALLADGTYIYSDIAEYSVYEICDYLYENSLSVNENAHACLGDLLKKINSSKELIAYDPK